MDDIVRDWKVSELETHSDHNLIEFKLQAREPETKIKTTMTNSQKDKFTSDLDEAMSKITDTYNNLNVNVNTAEDLTREIIEAYKKAERDNSTTTKIKHRYNKRQQNTIHDHRQQQKN